MPPFSLLTGFGSGVIMLHLKDSVPPRVTRALPKRGSMPPLKSRLPLWFIVVCLLAGIAVLPVNAQPQANSSDNSSRSESSTKSNKAKAPDQYKSTTGSDVTTTGKPSGESASAAANASTPSHEGAAQPAKAATPKVARASAAAATDPEIAAAQASGKVWVNLDSGIYHRNGRWFGKTKNGKFMTEAEAKAAGYRESQK